ncbi:MAG: nitroreductase family protein [Chloroflexota bacterium]
MDLKDGPLYDAILSRRSVRRYEATPMGEETLARVEAIVAGVRPLVSGNRFVAPRRDVRTEDNLTAMLGAYGKILTPPHFLVPHLVGEEHPLADLGYRVEQIAVRLARLGIGSCFVGALASEAQVRHRFALPETARIGAFLAFGHPTRKLFGRAVNATMRRATGATHKLPAARLFYDGTFEHPAEPPPGLAPLLEAARHAPSAVDAQPWRFLWRDGRLYLFVKRANPRYGPANQEYRLHDGGSCMANVSLALEAYGRAERWSLLSGDEPDLPTHPPTLQPLAVLSWLA